MIVAPNTFDPVHHRSANSERIRRIEELLAGRYHPKSLMDIFYGPLDDETQKGLPPASYYPEIYK
jgi:hypothetical protein